ncbi:MAG TPA: hypothetical protein VFD39_11965, partial [Trueperaceae bacterium]|nr:hypothetical protein [Trueperaceae bacterium]
MQCKSRPIGASEGERRSVTVRCTSARSATPWLVALALLVITACRIAPPPPPPPADTVVASGDFEAIVDSLSLAPGEWKDYQLNIPAGVRASYDVVYLELGNAGAGAVLELRSPTYWLVMASSAAPSRFTRGAISGVPQPVPAPAESEADSAVAPAAVTESRSCLGPCVIFAPNGGTYYARVVNDGGSTVNYDLYLYGYDLQDDTEPQNDSRSSSPVLGAEVSGAIELLGDQDYWLVPADLAVTFDTVAGVVSEVVVTSAGGLVVAGPYQPGDTFSVFAAESLRVRAAGNASAGAPAASTYFLSSSPLPPGTPGRPPSNVEVTAGTSASQPVDSRSFASGETVEYLLSVPSSVRDDEVMYVELSQNVALELRDGSGSSTIASSTSSASFFGGVGPFGEARSEGGEAGGLSPAAVDVNVDCRGSCVIVEPDSSTYRVYVTNFGGSRTISLYAYGFQLMDETE